MIGGRVQEQVEARKLLWWLATFNMMSVLLFALTASLSIPAMAISLALFGLSLVLSLPVQITILANEMPNHRASATGVYNFFRYVWMTIGPIAGTFFYRFGYRIEFVVFVLIFIAVLFFMYYRFFGVESTPLLNPLPYLCYPKAKSNEKGNTTYASFFVMVMERRERDPVQRRESCAIFYLYKGL